MHWAKAGLLVVWSCVIGAGCSSECDDELIDAAIEFVNAHQACEADGDCVVVHIGCSELPGSLCGQIALNRAGAESNEWRELQHELGDCGPNECAQCLAQLVPTCVSGSCSGPQ